MSHRLVKFTVGNSADASSAEVGLGFNIADDPSQIFLSIREHDDNGEACTAMSTEEARAILDHLNSLLGNPLSYGAPTA